MYLWGWRKYDIKLCYKENVIFNRCCFCYLVPVPVVCMPLYARNLEYSRYACVETVNRMDSFNNWSLLTCWLIVLWVLRMYAPILLTWDMEEANWSEPKVSRLFLTLLLQCRVAYDNFTDYINNTTIHRIWNLAIRQFLNVEFRNLQ